MYRNLSATLVIFLSGITLWAFKDSFCDNDRIEKEQAISSAYAVVASYPEDVSARRNLLGALGRGKHYDEEFLQLREINQKFPAQYDLIYNYGLCCYERKRYEEAERCLKNLGNDIDPRLELTRKKVLADIQQMRIKKQKNKPSLDEPLPPLIQYRQGNTPK